MSNEADDGKVDAVWVGGAGYALLDGTALEPGVTVARIGRDEAHGSDNWQPVEPAKRRRRGAADSTDQEGDA